MIIGVQRECVCAASGRVPAADWNASLMTVMDWLCGLYIVVFWCDLV